MNLIRNEELGIRNDYAFNSSRLNDERNDYYVYGGFGILHDESWRTFDGQEKAEIAALKGRPIVFDEDCPPTTEEQAAETLYLMRKYNTRRITKEIYMKEFPERFKKKIVG